MARYSFLLALIFGALAVGSTVVNVSIPLQVPANAAKLDSRPVGISIEFDMWPTYVNDLSYPRQCLDHVTPLYNHSRAPIRIGGTTQDRSTYDPTYDDYIRGDPANELFSFYGPKFFDLINSWGTETTIGFNRGDDNITNTLEAVLEVKARARQYLWGVELGNEPDLYYSVWNKTIAVAPWNNSQEGNNQAEWSQAFINAWGKDEDRILSAGTYAVPIPLSENYPSTDYLITEAFNTSVKSGIKMYCTHAYALSPATAELPDEMDHAKTVADISTYLPKIANAAAVGRPYVIGEAGFHGLETLQDATFGGALQIIDKTLRFLSSSVQRIYYHQGGLGTNQAAFNWWAYDRVEYPWYGGYFSSLAVSDGDYITAIDAGNTRYAQYVVYNQDAPSKVVLINTDYFSGIGSRSSTSFVLSGVTHSSTIRLIRFTAPSSEATANAGERSAPGAMIGGQYFSNDDCSILGQEASESVDVVDTKAEISLAASEAVIVYL